jgi:hypothetical protein
VVVAHGTRDRQRGNDMTRRALVHFALVSGHDHLLVLLQLIPVALFAADLRLRDAADQRIYSIYIPAPVWMGRPSTEIKRVLGHCAALVRHETSSFGRVSLPLLRPGDQQQPSSLNERREKCLECHMRPCVPGGNSNLDGWIDIRMRESSSSVHG